MQVKTQDAKKVIMDAVEKVCEIYKVVPDKKAIEEFLDSRDEGVSRTIAEKNIGTFYLRINLYCPINYTVDINTFLGHTDEVIDNLKKAGLNFYRPIDVPLDNTPLIHTLRIFVS